MLFRSATFLPVEPVGYSIEHMDVAGTKTLGFDEAVDRWLGIAEGLGRQGIRKFVMLNAHGGHSPLMTIVATEPRVDRTSVGQGKSVSVSVYRGGSRINKKNNKNI